MSEVKKLLFFVEGVTDKIYFENVIEPRLYAEHPNVDEISYFQYSEKPNHYVESRVRAIRRSSEAIFIFVSDLQPRENSESKKKNLMDQYSELEKSKIQIVIQEIESWYLAGLAKRQCENLNVPYCDDTEELSKKEILEKIPENRYRNDRIKDGFLFKLCEKYLLDNGRSRNESLSVFCDRVEI